VGSARTALFNWLFARQNGGTFILRIEDTDAERNREEWVAGISSALSWLGMDPDKGPYRQSERSALYGAALDALWEGGYLYACSCTREETEVRTKGNPVPGYDGFCRDRGLARGPGVALRFRTPDEGSTVVQDLIRGDVSFPHAAMEDFVVAKSNGQPLFVLANVVDDRAMAITHVIRGEDLLPSTPKGLLIWQALDSSSEGSDAPTATPVPFFAHLPMLVNEQRKKLSKRRDPVAVESYRDQGYLPTAFRNYLALLGWSPSGGAEKVPLEQIVEEFRLEAVHHAPAFFDVQKLTHLNGAYVRELSGEAFVTACLPWIAPDPSGWAPAAAPPWPADRFDRRAFGHLAPLVQERVATLGEVQNLVDFVFLPGAPDDPTSWGRAMGKDPDAPAVLTASARAYETVPWDRDSLHACTRALADSFGRKLGAFQAPVRVAVMGRTAGLPLFESLEVLGRDEVLRRIAAALERIGSESEALHMAHPGGEREVDAGSG
jgi:glutamyl-tRNA synthetase